MSKIQKIFGIILTVFVSLFASAQELKISAEFSNDSIILGQQTTLSINVKHPGNINLKPALLADTIIKNIEILHTHEIERYFDSIKDLHEFTEKYVVTSFDTGHYTIPGIKLTVISDYDSIDVFTNELFLRVFPYVLIDTIPVDTVYAGKRGFVIFGKNSFQDEINMSIPDSVRRKLSKDSLKNLQQQIAQNHFHRLASQIISATGFTDNEQILKIAEAKKREMFIIGRDGIEEIHIVAGSLDSLFVQELQPVIPGTPLFTLYRIKDIEESLFTTPFNLAELWFHLKRFFIKYWWAIILCLFLIFGIIYYFLYYRTGEKPVFLRIKPQEPPHITALEKLKKIKNEKIWKSGRYKEYHVAVTNVIREYIDKRFGVYAMEMTSSEILEALEDKIENEVYKKLSQIFTIADAVKFAKAVPLQNENDLSLSNAFAFVEKTKEVREEGERVKKVEAEIELHSEKEKPKESANETEKTKQDKNLNDG